MLSRICNYIYEIIKYPNEPFNHFIKQDTADVYGAYFIHLPMMFYSLASVWFLMRWLAFYYSTPECMNYNHRKAQKGSLMVKVIFAVVSVITAVGYILSLVLGYHKGILKLYIWSVFFITSVGLQITLRMYLSQVKTYKYYREENRKLTIVAWLISSLLFLRGVDILIVFIAHNFVSEGTEGERRFFLFFDIFKLVFYFLETGPAMVVLYTQWRSYREITSLIKEQAGLKRLIRDESSFVSGYNYSRILAHQQSQVTEQPSVVVDQDKSSPNLKLSNSTSASEAFYGKSLVFLQS